MNAHIYNNPQGETSAGQRSPQWVNEFANSIRSKDELLRELALTESDLPYQLGDGGDFSLRVPRSYVARMKSQDPMDPLLLQVIPRLSEEEVLAAFVCDPVGDLTATKQCGILQKYVGRVLLMVTSSCAVHCRYCFRREYPYDDGVAKGSELDLALASIDADQSISEVILSGGDPLSMATPILRSLLYRIQEISHVKRIRIHTRFPIVLPSRIDKEFLGAIGGLHKRMTIVLHANHANELRDDCAEALQKLHKSGVALLNQSVLLRGVNDSVESLANLSETLHELGVLPYYLHALDRVRGAHEFFVEDARGIKLIEGLRQILPGYLVPRFVREEAGEPSKTALI
jgi:EF-P beta-lysylation protein EpmB